MLAWTRNHSGCSLPNRAGELNHGNLGMRISHGCGIQSAPQPVRQDTQNPNPEPSPAPQNPAAGKSSPCARRTPGVRRLPRGFDSVYGIVGPAHAPICLLYEVVILSFQLPHEPRMKPVSITRGAPHQTPVGFATYANNIVSFFSTFLSAGVCPDNTGGLVLRFLVKPCFPMPCS